jgi:phenylacetate-CoA ligase
MGTRAITFFREQGLTTRFEVVSGGIDAARFAPAASAQREYDLILCCRLVPIKRVDVFLRTVARVAASLPRVRAVIVGDGPLRPEMEALATELGIAENVTFAGQQHDVENWLRRSRLFILTSDSEGLSLSLMEAMMTGLPAVVSRVGDLGDLVEDGVNGWLIGERTPDAFAERVLQLLTDHELWTRCSAAAARSAAVHHPTEVTRRWDRILGSLDDGHPQSAATIRAFSRKNAWERLPTAVKRAAEPVLSRLPSERLLGRQFTRELQLVLNSDAWSSDQIRSYQLAQLRSICTRAMETPYYSDLFRKAGFDPRDLTRPEQLAGLPTLERDTVRDRLDSLCAFPRRSRRVDYVSTGGSSGAPLRFYINADRSSFEYAHLVAGWRRAGFTLAVPLAVFRGRVVAADATGLHHEYDPLLRHHYYSSFHLNAEQTPRYLAHIRRLGPCYLHGYPSSISALANYIRSTGEEPPRNILGVLAESETVTDAGRTMASKTFGCQYFSSYGLTEKVVAAAGCEHSTKYHFWPTYGYFELLDNDGRPITSPGQRGEIVGTGFINTAMPFIRYRTGDFATYVGEACPSCGRAHTIVEHIRGRRPLEWLVGRDWSLISWTALNTHDDTFENVLRFQFYQDTPGLATLRIVPSSQFSQADVARIRRTLGAKLDGTVEFAIELVPTLRFSNVGKALYVDQRLSIPAQDSGI